MNKLVLIDGNSLLNRAFYATPVFTTKDGTPTNAVFGFTKILLKIITDVKCEYMVVAFDLKAPTFRHKLYTEYKGTRKGMPDELAIQLPILKELLKLMNITIYEQAGYEADDIIGTLSKKYDNIHSIIYTGDRDSYQLVSENTDVYFTKKGVSELEKLTIENFSQLVGCTPKQIIDMKALMGDKSDNIPGIVGIGEKTAHDLISKYNNLDGVYENLEELTGSSRTKIASGKEMAYLSRVLATIDTDMPIDLDITSCFVPNKFSSQVKEKFTALEFRSLMNLDIFEEKIETQSVDKITILDANKLQEILAGVEEIAISTENGLNIFVANKEFSMPLRQTLLDEGFDSIDDLLIRVFDSYKGKIIAYDSKQLRHLLHNLGREIENDIQDVSLLKYLVDYTGKEETLKFVADYYGLNFSCPAYAVLQLFTLFNRKLVEENLVKLYTDIELPLSKCLYNMEVAGFKVDEEKLNEAGLKYKEELNTLSEQVFQSCGTKFNLNSPSQLGEVLFDKLQLGKGKKGKTGKYSTNAEVLENLADEHPVIELIQRYRQIQKLSSTYVEGLKPLIDKKTGLVHTRFNQVMTATGRLSSTNPNLQNIPVRENEGKLLRKFFVASDENHILIDADYSQIELRLLAHFSGCKELVDAYNNGEDIHSLTASQVFNVPLNEVTGSMRRSAKAVNFGIIYGISEFGLSKQLKIAPSKAKEYIKKYFESYSDVKKYMENNVEIAKQNGYITTLTGRKRVINELKSTNYNTRSFGERVAMNMPLQGSSADIIKIAMLNVEKRLKENGLKSKLILQVHDELIIDALKTEQLQVSEILKEEMENAVQLLVPLTVEVACGESWFDCK